MNTLQVTKVEIFPLHLSSIDSSIEVHTKALARVVLNEQLQLTGIRVMMGENGLSIAYPNKGANKGEDWLQIFYPITDDLKAHIEHEVIIEYNKKISNKG